MRRYLYGTAVWFLICGWLCACSLGGDIKLYLGEMYTDYTPAILGHLDILVAGPYVQSLKMPLQKTRSPSAASQQTASQQTASQQAALLQAPSLQQRSPAVGQALLGSSNQRLHLLSRRHERGDLTALPSAEVILRPDGTVVLTGSAPLRLKHRRSGGRRSGMA